MTRAAVLQMLWCIWLFINCTTYYHPRMDRQPTVRKSPAVLKPEGREHRDILVKKLLSHIKAYLGTPYQFGGDSRKGMDCSGFVATVFKESFQIELPHNAKQLYENCQKIGKSELNFGDLVFFSNRHTIDHVGIYLAKNYFVHASVSYGVIVSSSTEKYYRTRYAAAGRIVDLKTVGKQN